MGTTERRAAILIAGSSAMFVFRERTVSLLALLFVALVLVSAYLGWSATTTVNAIYLDASDVLTAAGRPVPPNPVHDISPLSLLRNMSVYVMLIGSLAAIVIGHQLIAIDRKSGVLPLIGTRPMTCGAYATGKITAIAVLVLCLMGIAAAVSLATFVLLPEFRLDAASWLDLAGFFALSALYMLLFGLMALASSATARSESVGLLIPVTIWLTLTFIFPAIIANVHPTAALNPVSALATPPDSAFFKWAGQVLGPFSLADSYRFASARLLVFLPESSAFRSPVPPVLDLAVATMLAGVVAARAILRMDVAHGHYNV